MSDVKSERLNSVAPLICKKGIRKMSILLLQCEMTIRGPSG
uniref:Uncharacterized protein n=1 Tax=Arundo donax TaxID=35708 RepID=A0A0A9FPM9_ARUDO